jgi:kynurenine formamidase
MKLLETMTFAVMTAGAAVTIVTVTAGAPVPQGGSDNTVSKEEYQRWTKELTNWGRWGKDDEIGTLNLITAAKRKAAAALVKDGFSVSLAVDADTVKAIDNPNPYELSMLSVGSDRIAVSYHGQAHTHLDSLAHHFDFDGAGYNGYKPDADLVMKQGHPKNSIHNVKSGIFTRGILIDIPRLQGLQYLEPGTPIYVKDLEAFLKMAGLKLAPGDALFVRAGVWARRKAVGPYLRGRGPGGRDAGLDPSVIPWLKQQDVALLGSDHPQYVSPSSLPGAVHDFALVGLGVHLFDNCDLEALSEAAAERKRWEFLLTAAPLPIRGGTGSPINPIATF